MNFSIIERSGITPNGLSYPIFHCLFTSFVINHKVDLAFVYGDYKFCYNKYYPTDLAHSRKPCITGNSMLKMILRQGDILMEYGFMKNETSTDKFIRKLKLLGYDWSDEI